MRKIAKQTQFLLFLAGILFLHIASVKAQYSYPGATPSKQYTIAGTAITPQSPQVADVLGVTSVGFLYQYDALHATSLEEGQNRIGNNHDANLVDPDTGQPAVGLGSHVIKIWFDRTDLMVQGYPNTGGAPYPLTNVNGQGSGPNGQVASLVELASSAPMQELFSNSDFKVYILEANEFCQKDGTTANNWMATLWKPRKDIYGTLHQINFDSVQSHGDIVDCVKSQFQALAAYLLTTYNNTGKTFILQNWEGDNDLNPASFTDANTTGPTPSSTETCSTANYTSEGANFPLQFCNSVLNMIWWQTLRWEGVNAARAASTSTNVTVASAFEVNQIDGYTSTNYNEPTVMDLVVPYIHTDLYSCSCYYADSNLPNSNGSSVPRPQNLYNAIMTLYNGVGGTGGIVHSVTHDAGTPLWPRSLDANGKLQDVYIGEFGAPENHVYGFDTWGELNLGIPSDQYQRAITGQQVAGALAAGVKWLVYWQVYSNGTRDGLSDQNYNNIDGVWLVRPSCNSTSDNIPGSAQPWCVRSTPANFTISQWQVSGNVATFVSNYLPVAGQSLTLQNFVAGSFFNGQAVTVLSAGLGTYGSGPNYKFEASFTHANTAWTTDNGQAVPQQNNDGKSKTATWSYFADIMSQSVDPSNAHPYQNVYEAEDYFTGLSGAGSPTETDFADAQMSGGYAAVMQNTSLGSGSTPGSTMTFSLFVPKSGSQTVSIRVKTGSTHGNFNVYLNGSTTPLTSTPLVTYCSGNNCGSYVNLSLGSLNLTAGVNTFAITVAGVNGSLFIDNFQINP